jgi:hypothetical protein
MRLRRILPVSRAECFVAGAALGAGACYVAVFLTIIWR